MDIVTVTHRQQLLNMQKTLASQIASTKQGAPSQVKAVEHNIAGYLEMNHQLAKEWEDANDKTADTQKKMADIQDISDKRLEREQDKKNQGA
jgi:hypothetical protein